MLGNSRLAGGGRLLGRADVHMPELRCGSAQHHLGQIVSSAAQPVQMTLEFIKADPLGGRMYRKRRHEPTQIVADGYCHGYHLGHEFPVVGREIVLTDLFDLTRDCIWVCQRIGGLGIKAGDDRYILPLAVQ
jgi:hypothetical protein